MYVCMPCVYLVPREVKEGTEFPQNWRYRSLWSHEAAGSSGRAASDSDLNCLAISQDRTKLVLLDLKTRKTRVLEFCVCSVYKCVHVDVLCGLCKGEGRAD